MAATRWLLWAVLLGAVASAGGCTYAMRMPREELRIMPLAGERSPFLREAGVLTVPGIAHYGDTLSSSSGMIAVAMVSVSPSRPARSALASWDLSTGSLLGLLEDPSETFSDEWGGLIDLSPDGSRVVIRKRAGAEVRDVRTGAILQRLDEASGRSPWPAKFDHAGQRVMITNHPKHRRTWIDVDTGEETVAGPLNWPGPLAQCGDVAVDTAGRRNSPFVLNLRTGERVHLELRAGRGGVARSAVFSDDCRFVAIGYTAVWQWLMYDLTPSHVRIWDTRTGRLVAWFQLDGTEPSYFSPEIPIGIIGESQLLLVHGDDVVRLIDLRAGREIGRDWFPSERRLTSVVPVDGGRLLLVPEREGVRMYRVEVPATQSGESVPQGE